MTRTITRLLLEVRSKLGQSKATAPFDRSWGSVFRACVHQIDIRCAFKSLGIQLTNVHKTEFDTLWNARVRNGIQSIGQALIKVPAYRADALLQRRLATYPEGSLASEAI
eukprot:1796360-Amphidinium_carterae.1